MIHPVQGYDAQNEHTTPALLTKYMSTRNMVDMNVKDQGYMFSRSFNDLDGPILSLGR